SKFAASLHLPSAPLPNLHSFPTRRSSDLIVSFKSNFIYKARNFRPVEELCGAQKPLRAQSVFLRPKNLPFGRQVVANRRERCLIDRKSTRLNSSHRTISYAVFCLKKKNRK